MAPVAFLCRHVCSLSELIVSVGRGTPFHQNGNLARKTMFLTGFWIVGILSLGQNLFKNVHFLVPSDVSKTLPKSVTVDVPDRNAFLHRFDVDLR